MSQFPHVYLQTCDGEHDVLLRLSDLPELVIPTSEFVTQQVPILLTHYRKPQELRNIVAYLGEQTEQLSWELDTLTPEGLYLTLSTSLDLTRVEGFRVEVNDGLASFYYRYRSQGTYQWDLRQSYFQQRLVRWYDNPRGRRYLYLNRGPRS